MLYLFLDYLWILKHIVWGVKYAYRIAEYSLRVIKCSTIIHYNTYC